MQSVQFVDNDIKSNLRNKTRLKTFLIRQIKKATGRTPILTYIFTTDAFLLQLNIDFLQHDTYTDIITFDLSETEAEITGEIYISAERVKENAKAYACSYQLELQRVLFHGALHLCGYKDKTKKDKALMTDMENQWIAQFKRMR